MYNTKYVCSYLDSDVFIETDILNEQEKDFIRNCIYRQDFLNIFGLEEFKDEDMNAIFTTIYDSIKNNIELRALLTKIIEKYEIDDGVTAVMLLYSFDYMQTFHECMCEYLDTGQMTSGTITKLNEILL